MLSLHSIIRERSTQIKAREGEPLVTKSVLKEAKYQVPQLEKLYKWVVLDANISISISFEDVLVQVEYFHPPLKILWSFVHPS